MQRLQGPEALQSSIIDATHVPILPNARLGAHQLTFLERRHTLNWTTTFALAQ